MSASPSNIMSGSIGVIRFIVWGGWEVWEVWGVSGDGEIEKDLAMALKQQNYITPKPTDLI
ncbi:hypothetical protein CYANOKiyG1_07930 [Okeania sp. KiyG1]|nr:hypothetical protein CYANOKiyG1_07930 [Okeania sp. KiyG1]